MPVIGPQRAAFRTPAAGVFPARPTARPMIAPDQMARAGMMKPPMARPMMRPPQPAMAMGGPGAVAPAAAQAFGGGGPGAPPVAAPAFGGRPPADYGGMLDAIRRSSMGGAAPTLPGAAGANLAGLGMAQAGGGVPGMAQARPPMPGGGIGIGLATRKPTLAQAPLPGRMPMR